MPRRDGGDGATTDEGGDYGERPLRGPTAEVDPGSLSARGADRAGGRPARARGAARDASQEAQEEETKKGGVTTHAGVAASVTTRATGITAATTDIATLVPGADGQHALWPWAALLWWELHRCLDDRTALWGVRSLLLRDRASL